MSAEPSSPVAAPIVTLTTDFGLRDAYVGVMQGVILGRCPAARLVDLSHRIAAQDILQAAFCVSGACRWFPAGTVHLIVVDPGVGSARRAIAARATLPGPDGAPAEHYFVAPDNGVLTPILEADPSATVVELANPAHRLPRLSRTFHGRDLFAPAAAALAAGVPLAELGPVVADPVRLAWPAPQRDIASGELHGEIVYVDGFGNLITNLPAAWLEAGGEWTVTIWPAPGISAEAGNFADGVTTKGMPLSVKECGDPILSLQGVSAAYSDVAPGAALAILDSFDRLEVAVNGGSASATLAVGVGAQVRCRPRA